MSTNPSTQETPFPLFGLFLSAAAPLYLFLGLFCGTWFSFRAAQEFLLTATTLAAVALAIVLYLVLRRAVTLLWSVPRERTPVHVGITAIAFLSMIVNLYLMTMMLGGMIRQAIVYP